MKNICMAISNCRLFKMLLFGKKGYYVKLKKLDTGRLLTSQACQVHWGLFLDRHSV